MNAARPPEGARHRSPQGEGNPVGAAVPGASPPGPGWFERVQASFERQGMMRHLGASLVRVEPGLCEVALPYSDRVTQQQGGFHGGAMGALADIAGGYAGLTLAPAGTEVTTVEYKINFLRALQGGRLHATGRVVRAGRRLIVTVAEVVQVAGDGRRQDCALMQQTLMVVDKQY